MPVTLSDVIDDLLKRKTQDSGRLDLLAKYCIEAFEREGLPGVRGGKADEVGIRGLGRQKDWDLAYVLAGKPRLGNYPLDGRMAICYIIVHEQGQP
jgi:hypothetical protein